MRSFKDTLGREWQLSVTTSAVRRVRDATGVLLTGLFQDNWKLLDELSLDTPKLCDVLFALCHDQVTKVNVSIDSFSDAINGNAIRDALEALVRESIDFFSSQDQRPILHQMLDKLIETRTAVVTAAAEQVAQFNPSQLASELLPSATNSQGEPALTPTTELLASLP